MVILVLVGAYRSLGGAAPTVADPGSLLRSLESQLRSSLDALSALLDSSDEPVGAGDAARDGRKLTAAVQQTLDRLPPTTELDDDTAAARHLLSAAAEDCAWAWRVVQGAVASPALTEAARLLTDHAAGCCEGAAALLRAALRGEPGDGA